MATRTTEPHRPEAVSREFSSPRVVSREGPPFPSLEKLFFSTMEGRKEAQDRTGQDRTGQVRRVQRARLDRRRLSRNTATRRMENKGRRKTGGESVSKRARIRRKSSEGNKFFFGRLEDPPSSPLVWEDYLLEKYPNPVSVSPTIPKTRVRPLKLVSRGE